MYVLGQVTIWRLILTEIGWTAGSKKINKTLEFALLKGLRLFYLSACMKFAPPITAPKLRLHLGYYEILLPSASPSAASPRLQGVKIWS